MSSRLSAASGLATALGLALAACASSRAPHGQLADVWRDYQALPEYRALALAGDLRSDRWVVGASGGHASAAAAESSALDECMKRRQRNRMQHPCRLYATGEVVVWHRSAAPPQPQEPASAGSSSSGR